VAAALGDACTGLDLGGNVVGCEPPAGAPAASVATIETHGSVLGDSQVVI
jgi:hypothetical protein